MTTNRPTPDWWFPENLSGQMTFKDPLAGLITPNSELDGTEILVRESLQNSLDAGTPDAPVRVRFRLRMLRAQEKVAFLDALGMGGLERHVKSSNDAIQRNEGDVMSDPVTLHEEDPIVALYIEDHGTCGLVGPEFHNASAADDYEGTRSFLGLCRSIGANDKASEGSGGTYGFGKGVYWANSSIGTAIFHSRLESAWSASADEDLPDASGAIVEQRLFGVARLASHVVGESVHDQNGWFMAGKTPHGPRSHWNGGAAQRASALGFTERAQGDPGTSILIAPVKDPEDGTGRAKVLTDAASFMDRLMKAAARYFWPAIVEGRLEVEVQVDAGEPMGVEPGRYPELAPFLKVHRNMVGTATESNVECREVASEVPVWRDKEIEGGEAKVRLGVHLDEQELSRVPEPGPGPGRVALVRGAQMVVGYWDPKGRGTSPTSFHGLVRAGLAHGDEARDEDMEKLLQRAEPVTHDRWDEKSEPLKPWRAAQSRVRDLLGKIRAELSEIVGQSTPPSGAGPMALRKLLALQADGPGSGDRFGSIEFRGLERKVLEGDSARSERELLVTIPARRGSKRRPNAVRIAVSHGVRKDESSSGRTKEVVGSTLEVLTVEGLAPERVSGDPTDSGAALTLDLEGVGGEVRLTVLASTETMPADRFSRRQFDCRVHVQVPVEEVIR
ncbi:MAG: hypothetical protein ACYTFV_01055 [Planctomycetota bacterium]|jgi:hypothetical protein